MKSQVELVTTGSELLSGRTLNRHAQTLGESLRPLGLRLVRDTTIPDDIPVIREAVAEAMKRVDILFVSGGLGPTSDDVTREAIAGYLNRKIELDAPTVEVIRERMKKMGRVFNEPSERQARVVDGAVVLPNAVGAAPGEWLDLGTQWIFVLPGPPREFLSVLEKQIIPLLQKRLSIRPPLDRIFMVCGLGESDIVKRLEEGGFTPENLEVAYCASPGRVEIRLTSLDHNEALLEREAGKVEQLMGENIFAVGRYTLAQTLGTLLQHTGETLATAESCTGGFLGHQITSVAGSSDYYLGGVVAYANEVKVRELGVKEETLKQWGAVSEQTAGEMAAGVRKRFGTEYGLSITGIAGPSGGTAEKPVGLVYIALASSDKVWTRKFQFSGDRAWIKEWAAQMAMDLLRRKLQGYLV